MPRGYRLQKRYQQQHHQGAGQQQQIRDKFEAILALSKKMKKNGKGLKYFHK